MRSAPRVLRADRAAIDEANQNKQAYNLEGNESTSAIDTLLLEGGSAVTQLDAIMRNKYKRNPDKLHAWTRAPDRAQSEATKTRGRRKQRRHPDDAELKYPLCCKPIASLSTRHIADLVILRHE